MACTLYLTKWLYNIAKWILPESVGHVDGQVTSEDMIGSPVFLSMNLETSKRTHCNLTDCYLKTICKLSSHFHISYKSCRVLRINRYPSQKD